MKERLDTKHMSVETRNAFINECIHKVRTNDDEQALLAVWNIVEQIFRHKYFNQPNIEDYVQDLYIVFDHILRNQYKLENNQYSFLGLIGFYFVKIIGDYDNKYVVIKGLSKTSKYTIKDEEDIKAVEMFGLDSYKDTSYAFNDYEKKIEKEHNKKVIDALTKYLSPSEKIAFKIYYDPKNEFTSEEEQANQFAKESGKNWNLNQYKKYVKKIIDKINPPIPRDEQHKILTLKINKFLDKIDTIDYKINPTTIKQLFGVSITCFNEHITTEQHNMILEHNTSLNKYKDRNQVKINNQLKKEEKNKLAEYKASIRLKRLDKIKTFFEGLSLYKEKIDVEYISSIIQVSSQTIRQLLSQEQIDTLKMHNKAYRKKRTIKAPIIKQKR